MKGVNKNRGEGDCGKGCVRGLGTFVRRHWGFSVLIPACSSQVEWTHSRAWLSSSLKIVTLQGKVCLKESKVLPERVKEAKKMWKTTFKALSEMKRSRWRYSR